MPNFILIRQTVWPQYTNVTDRQRDRQTDRQLDTQGRQWSDSIGRTVLQTVAQKMELIWFDGRGNLDVMNVTIRLGDVDIGPVDCVRDLGDA